MLTYVARLAYGEPVDDRMRSLIAAWCRRCVTKGRPPNRLKKMAVQWALLERELRDPSLKREATVAEVGKEHGLGRSEVFRLIRGIDPETYRALADYDYDPELGGGDSDVVEWRAYLLLLARASEVD